jgi:hypothetical protein
LDDHGPGLSIRQNGTAVQNERPQHLPLALPVDLRDWVAEDDLVHFVIHPGERLPLSAFAVNYKGCGDEQSPSHMRLAVLADCGYADNGDLRRLQRERPALDLYVSVYREDAHEQRRCDCRPVHKVKAPGG